ncbi:Mrp/NBP35 family ATP-binding protein [Acidisoma cellulosilytica]|uniref:Iron-sulfur cluster carrier protein n=1 Tax=Acidisoma cellulosilyticum TaxID=2802395 RepID=A0A963YYV7_9PROT|nr:Mrp/NBP35 family ATP-binding protein [Acidisoma cellulosilyticum]MCB8879416.1 Mrp/NBP35 family ATP-binding protein [Acidisoma cellulosilyticum]
MAEHDDALALAARRLITTFQAEDAKGELLGATHLEGIAVRDGLVQVTLGVDRARAGSLEQARRAAEAAIARLPGVRNATVVLTAHRAPQETAPAPQTGGHAGHGHGAASRPPAPKPQPIPGIAHIIAVGSGKGGVGKSTVSVNLAVALAQAGLRVGLMDADIYGPSLPRMLGASRRPDVRGDRLIPIEAWGLKAMSMGFLVEEDSAMIWRGPMIMGAVQQFLGQVEWGELDVLVVDLPPGTGDIQLTLSQRAKVTGAVIVSTPQDIALIDARRAVKMFEKVEIPIFGVIENMSYFCCPNCGHQTNIFGHGGARAEAATLGQAFLGEIPLLPEVRAMSDAGTPVVTEAPDSEAGRAFAAIAQTLLSRLGAETERA